MFKLENQINLLTAANIWTYLVHYCFSQLFGRVVNFLSSEFSGRVLVIIQFWVKAN